MYHHVHPIGETREYISYKNGRNRTVVTRVAQNSYNARLYYGNTLLLRIPVRGHAYATRFRHGLNRNFVQQPNVPNRR